MDRPSAKRGAAQPAAGHGTEAEAPRAGESAEQALYEVRRKIYPRAVRGWFAAWRWALVWLTQLAFYGLPWLSWNGRQALLFDIAQRKFFIFGAVFWPQDVIYLTVLLIISALALFLFTAVAGRLWCGYACPQTVYTELFMWIERVIEGDRVRRIRLDQAPWGARKLALKSAKHGAWIALSLWTGFTFVGYFTPIRELGHAVLALSLGGWESFWILFYGFATYGNAGWMREQVCKYMCPYARFQSAMFDKDTMIITYDRERGEPRGPRARGAEPQALGLGACVDCGICVQVCPTGIDIRDGLQYECIGCAACIDGCNQVMDRMGYARGLIRYSTTHAMDTKLTRAQMFARAFRPRVLLYSAALWAIIIGTGVALYLRVPLKLDVIGDRTAISREVEGGQIENLYQLQIMNVAERAHDFEVGVEGLPTIHLTSPVRLRLAGASSRLVLVKVRVERARVATGSHRIEFELRALDGDREHVEAESVFIVR